MHCSGLIDQANKPRFRIRPSKVIHMIHGWYTECMYVQDSAKSEKHSQLKRKVPGLVESLELEVHAGKIWELEESCGSMFISI